MTSPYSLSAQNPSLEGFLFATVAEEGNGMRLSVISALARMNVDPWEETARLAAMPRALAENALVSILDAVCGKNGIGPENSATAARLVQLLPNPEQASTAAAANEAKAQPVRANYMWVCLCFGLVMAFFTTHQQGQTTPAPGATISDAAPASPSKAEAVTPHVPLSR